MPLKKLYESTYQWVNERAGLDDILDFLHKKEVPICNRSIWYYFGGISMFLFLVQVITGILLLMYYRPGPDSSYESLQLIVSKVHFGWLVRDIHSWSANLMILCVFIHMFSVFFMKSYRKPREMTWITGMILLSLALGFGFSGYLLPWNELAFFATKVGTDMAVPDLHLKDMMESYRSMLATERIRHVIFGHIGNNHLHVNMIPSNYDELLRAKKLYLSFAKRAVDMGGSVSAEHGIGKLKKEFLTIQYGEEAIGEMRAVKNALDPGHLLNPGDVL